MPTRLLYLSLVISLLLVPAAHAQQLATKVAASATAPTTGATAAPSKAAPAAPAASDPASIAIQKAVMLMNKDDVDGSLDQLNQAIKIDPKNLAAYVLRASIFSQKKQWDQASQDFTTASELAPKNVVLKFNIPAVKFMQKKFDEARVGYLALEKDQDLGDFASYNVFLCDLAGGHQDVAAKELAVFNKVGANPSYYFGNAAWEISQKNYDKAKDWLGSASRIYDAHKSAYYAQSLVYLDYLPLPGEKPADTFAK